MEALRRRSLEARVEVLSFLAVTLYKISEYLVAIQIFIKSWGVRWLFDSYGEALLHLGGAARRHL